jgi:hypothetical protein
MTESKEELEGGEESVEGIEGLIGTRKLCVAGAAWNIS